MFFASTASAQTKTISDEPVIDTDGPSVTPTPFTVPSNYIQAENGLALTKESRGRSLSVPETLLRLGLLPRAELRLVVPNYLLIQGVNPAVSGVSDMSVGTKIRIGPLPRKINLAVIAGLTVPTGSKDLTSNAVDPFVQIIAGRKLSENWTLRTAHAVFVRTQAEESQNQGQVQSVDKNVVYQPTCDLIRRLGPNGDCFAEYVGNFQRSTRSNQFIDAGVLYRFRRNQQLNARFGVGLTSNSPAAFVEFGYSLLLGKLLK